MITFGSFDFEMKLVDIENSCRVPCIQDLGCVHYIAIDSTGAERIGAV